MYLVNERSFSVVKESVVKDCNCRSDSLSICSDPEDTGLSGEDNDRYARQLLLIGSENQDRLKGSNVLIAGTGGLGSPVAYYLTAAGVGRLTLVDYDRVSLSNLNRQILHWTSDLGKEKTRSAKEKLKALNPKVQITIWNKRITRENLPFMAQDADIIIDATDNYETRFILNEYSVKTGKPFIHGAVNGFSGQMLVVIPDKTACLSCLFTKSPPGGIAPVIGVTPGIIGSMQASEAIKLLTGGYPVTSGEFISWDGITTTLKKYHVSKKDNCPICGKNPKRYK
jgi:molybdopterin-synthase adenylyltransferase